MSFSRFRLGSNLLLIGLMLIAATLQARPLPAAEVFQVQVEKIDPNTFAIHWQIKPNYFLYQERIQLHSDPNANLELGKLQLPQSLHEKHSGHPYDVYRNTLSIPVRVLATSPGETWIELHFQGCSDEGYCYPPEIRTIQLRIDKTLALSQVAFVNPEQLAVKPSTTEPSHEVNAIFNGHSWPVIFLIFFGFGLLLSFTPCILPMVPVLSGIIVGHGSNMSTKKAFFLSLSYVLSMSITYAALGAVVALLGANLQIDMQAPWVIGLMSGIFILLALSMFGLYELQLPNAWQSKIFGSNPNRGGHYWGAALMGCLSTLVLSPCVTAPLIAVLAYIAHTGNVLLGALLLFILGLGMGTPLLLIGTSAGKWLPKSGPWMTGIKIFFGFIFLAIAVHLMDRILYAKLMMFLWCILLLFAGIYCGALSQAKNHFERFLQGLGLLLLAYSLLILIGASMGYTNPLEPLGGNRQAVNIDLSNNSSQPPKVYTLETLSKTIQEAKGKPILLDFYARWCTSCQHMEATTFKDPRVQQALSQYQVIRVDLTANNADNKAIMRHFDVIAPPTFLFFNAKGTELTALRRVGELSAKEFLDILSI